MQTIPRKITIKLQALRLRLCLRQCQRLRMIHKFLSIYLCAIFTLCSVSSIAFSQKSSDDRASIMNVILLDALFIAEYVSVVDLVAAGKMAQVKNKKDFFKTKEGLALFKRAVFGYSSARGRALRLKDFGRAESLIKEHNLLKNREKIMFDKKPEVKILETVLWPGVNESFLNPKFKDYWSDLGTSYTAKWPNWQDDSRFSDLVKKFLSQKTEADGIKENERGLFWSKNLTRFSLEELQYLAINGFESGGDKEHDAYTAEMFFSAYEKAGFMNEQDRILRLAYGLTLFWQARFSESLRMILELQDKNPSYRLAYEIIQRIYSFQHAGKGEVALQGL